MTADIKRVKWTRDVYEPSDDSFLLVDALQARLERKRRRKAGDAGSGDAAGGGGSVAAAPWPRVAVEIGCGSGYVITSLALLLRACAGEAGTGNGGAAGGPTAAATAAAAPPPPPPPALLIATDVSGPALASTAETLAAHGLRAGGDVELVQGDLVEPLRRRLRGAVDLLIFNPPYVPTPDDEVVPPVLPKGAPSSGGGGGGGGLGIVAAAWAGGDRGRRVVDRLLPQLGELLSEEGEAFVVAVGENDPEGMIRAVEEQEQQQQRQQHEGATSEPAGAVAAAAGEGLSVGGGAQGQGRRSLPLRGEVMMRRAADEEALCILRFFRGGAGGGGAASPPP